MTPFYDVDRWMRIAGQVQGDEFNPSRVCFQLGLMCEELSEIFDAVIEAGENNAPDLPPAAAQEVQELTVLNKTLKNLSMILRQGMFQDVIALTNKIDILDGLVDLMWVTIGSMVQADFAGEMAWEELVRSNYSKFVEGSQGPEALLDKTGKVMKGPGFFKPCFKDCV